MAYFTDCSKIDLKRDSKDTENVKKLQTALKELGYYTEDGGSTLLIDGKFGPYTEKAVKAFQKATGHDDDGWFGPKTCPSLNEKYAEKTNAANNNNITVEEDNTPEAYKKVTHSLTILPDVVVLPETSLDTETQTKTSSGGSINTDTNFDCSKIDLKRNSEDKENVKKLQTILKSRGYYTRAVDGDFGKYTEKAVKKLQTAQGNDPDGHFGPKTCAKLQGTSATSNEATGTKNKKNTKFTITDIKATPGVTADTEGLTDEITINTPYTLEKYNRIRLLQKTEYTLKKGAQTIKKHNGYINNIKISNEDDGLMIELQIVNYIVFLEQSVEFGEKTAKRSELLKELIELAGLKANINTAGLFDDEYTIKVQKAEIKGDGGGAGAGLAQVDGNDCTPTLNISARSYDIDTCHGNEKIGKTSANYAQDTKNMTAKEAILDVFNRFHYGPSLSSSDVYENNRRCPQQMWSKTGKFWGNCADISRLVKAMGEVHGLKVGIRHAYKHYYNLIEWEGKVYKFDCCFSSTGYMSKRYGGEQCNNLNRNGGPWS